MLFGMTIVNAGNYFVNIVLGRYLSSAELGDAVLLTTCMLVLGAFSLALQSATARVAALDSSSTSTNAFVKRVERGALAAGAVVAVTCAGASTHLAQLFRVSSAQSFVWLGLLSPLLLLQGVRRGVLQGRNRTLHFTATFQVEMAVRLGISWLALATGMGLDGVCAALLLSVAASLASTLGAPSATSVERSSHTRPLPSGSIILPAIVSQLSVIAFTQADVIILKARVAPDLAGAFAIVVLTGRIVSFTGQAVATPLLPDMAKAAAVGRDVSSMLRSALFAVLAVSAPLLLGAVFLPELLISSLFGPQHLAAAPHLPGYALAMLLHTLAALVIDYAYCHGASRINFAAFGIGILKLVAGILLIDSLQSAVLINLTASVVLLSAMALLTRKIARPRQPK